MFLGVDGGGTKTALCLVTQDGALAGTTQTRSSYYLGSPQGTRLVRDVLEEGVGEVCRQAGIAPDGVTDAFFGLPAYGEASADLPALDSIPGEVLGHDRYACGNDMVAGWAGSLGAEDGINVVSGTGSICYGERDGRQARVGGWSELFGDEGSGYWIAVRGLEAFSRMSDGRLDPGLLLDAVRDHLGIAADLDAIGVVQNEWQGSRTRVAATSRVVAHAADLGDPVAREILAQAAAELVLLVETAAARLGFEDEEAVPVSYSGGVFSADVVRHEFVRLLGAAARRYDLREPLYTPSVGAALYAARLAGRPLAQAGRDRLLRQTWPVVSNPPSRRPT
ncbi:N-acetylglucosamine kinase [Xylanimonas sp. McL0601]|uniref:N-acetylglucosamine kinase n=1 Tax=Xylanimonas sp. McL0601 TaxID=3414739 RepID=UPI003CEA801A